MSTFEVTEDNAFLLGPWDAWMAQARASLYHRRAWLEAMAEESGADLVPLVCRAKAEVVGCYPVFVKRRGLTAVLSPPPGCLVAGLGPVVPVDEARSAAEKTHFAAIEAFEAFVEGHLAPDLVRVITATDLPDARPFVWAGYQTTPRYTYTLPLGPGAEAVFAAFKKQVRTDARRATRYDDLAVADGDRAAFLTVCRMVRSRYAEQGLSWGPSEEYLDRLYDAFGDEHIRTKAVVRDGEVLAGLVLLADGHRVQHWIGGLSYDADYIGLNELLHWETVQAYAEAGYETYELVGANTEHLCRHKAKYNPDLALYFELERATTRGRAARALLDAEPVRRLVRSLGV